jgi:hypothetical protein
VRSAAIVALSLTGNAMAVGAVRPSAAGMNGLGSHLLWSVAAWVFKKMIDGFCLAWSPHQDSAIVDRVLRVGMITHKILPSLPVRGQRWQSQHRQQKFHFHANPLSLSGSGNLDESLAKGKGEEALWLNCGGKQILSGGMSRYSLSALSGVGVTSFGTFKAMAAMYWNLLGLKSF